MLELPARAGRGSHRCPRPRGRPAHRRGPAGQLPRSPRARARGRLAERAGRRDPGAGGAQRVRQVDAARRSAGSRQPGVRHRFAWAASISPTSTRRRGEPDWPGFPSGRICSTPRSPRTCGSGAAEPRSRRSRRRSRPPGSARRCAGCPRGLDTVLGERGAGLSAGERQRLALARAFLRDAPLLLLDEPTASLDGQTEQDVVDAIRRLARGRTVVLVAHRPALIALADRVVSLAPVGTAA